MPLDLDALVLAPCHAVFGEVNRGFAQPVYTPAGGAAFAIDGVFRIPALDVLKLGDEPAISTRKPEIDFRLALFPPGVQPAQSDTVLVRGVLYSIADTRLDGDGLVTLELSEAPSSGPGAGEFLADFSLTDSGALAR